MESVDYRAAAVKCSCILLWIVIYPHHWSINHIHCLLCGQVRALTLGRPHRDALKELMNKKEIVGDLLNQLRYAQSLLAGRQLRTHQQMRGTHHSQRSTLHQP